MVYDKLYTERAKKPLLKSMMLLSDESPEDLHGLVALKKRLRNNYELEVDPIGDNLFLAQVSKRVWGKLVTGHALIDTGTKGCWITYTDDSGYFVRRVLEPLFRGLYPNIARIHFNYLQIERFWTEIKKVYPGSSIVTHVAYKRQHRIAREEPRGTHMVWETGAEEDLRKDAKEHRVWIDSLAFQVKDQDGMIRLEASLTAGGVARLRFGAFSEFYHNVIQLYIGLATEWKNFFTDRERRIEGGKVKLRPYLLQYPFDLERTQIKGLITDLRGSYSHSILLGGNPYFVANLTDYQDGSSFYLTVLGKKVTITPMLKSTPYALWRIASRVQRVVGEGEIQDIPGSREA